MTSRFETMMTKPQEVTICVERTCDLCGRTARRPDDGGRYGSNPWSDESYRVDHVLMLRESGHNYPEEGHFTTTESFDVCPDCWTSKVVTWFKSQGATTTFHESDG